MLTQCLWLPHRLTRKNAEIASYMTLKKIRQVMCVLNDRREARISRYFQLSQQDSMELPVLAKQFFFVLSTLSST